MTHSTRAIPAAALVAAGILGVSVDQDHRIDIPMVGPALQAQAVCDFWGGELIATLVDGSTYRLTCEGVDH